MVSHVRMCSAVSEVFSKAIYRDFQKANLCRQCDCRYPWCDHEGRGGPLVALYGSGSSKNWRTPIIAKPIFSNGGLNEKYYLDGELRKYQNQHPYQFKWPEGARRTFKRKVYEIEGNAPQRTCHPLWTGLCRVGQNRQGRHNLRLLQGFAIGMGAQTIYFA